MLISPTVNLDFFLEFYRERGGNFFFFGFKISYYHLYSSTEISQFLASPVLISVWRPLKEGTWMCWTRVKNFSPDSASSFLLLDILTLTLLGTFLMPLLQRNWLSFWSTLMSVVNMLVLANLAISLIALGALCLKVILWSLLWRLMV